MNPPVNPNYCVSVVEISKVVPIEKADNIQAAIIFGNSVIVSSKLEVGTKGIFFPLECQIGTKFLATHNLFRDKTLNRSNDKVGFFEDTGRVRAVKLRGQKSEGFFIPLADLNSDYDTIKTLDIGTDFDYIGDECICRKYVVKETAASSTKKSRQGKMVSRFSRLVENQFHLHVDTIQAKKNFWMIDPDDIISITDKWHGTSAVFSNVLVNKKLKWYEKLLLKLGINVAKLEYGNIYSSRKVIKNQYINEQVTGGFYKTDIWKYVNDIIGPIIPAGVSIYGEIVGYLPGQNKEIQPKYTYGCQINTCEFVIYRITNTNVDGVVTEYSWHQIKEFCKKYGIKHVPEFYYGPAKDLYPDLSLDTHWHDNVVTRLSTDFNLEKKCKYNPTQLAEGIVIRADTLYDCAPLKLKSFAFMQYETVLLDNGELDIESDTGVDDNDA
jgi:hypothetical protein